MLIAIDFDETLTADKDLWGEFIDRCSDFGHRIVCVTARRDTEENREIIGDFLIDANIEIDVYYTALESKVEFMKKRGLKVDIWIDDDPKTCAMGH